MLIVDLCWKKDSLSAREFVDPVIRALGGGVVRHYTELRQSDLKHAKGIVLCGTALKDNKVLGELSQFDWLRTFNRPVLGICSGAYVIGLTFGGELRRCLEIGAVQMRRIDEDVLLNGLDRFEGFCLHNFCLELPRDFIPLVKSKRCVEAFRHRNKPLYGFLFHPEVRLGVILQRFQKYYK